MIWHHSREEHPVEDVYRPWNVMLSLPLSQVEQLGLEASTQHPDFRLWLTSKPCLCFPVAVLQAGLKLSSQPLRNVRAGMLRGLAEAAPALAAAAHPGGGEAGVPGRGHSPRVPTRCSRGKSKRSQGVGCGGWRSGRCAG